MSYDPNQLETSPLYRVRLQIGDTNPSEMLTDAEISHFLTSNHDAVLPASIEALRVIIARRSHDKDHSANGFSVTGGGSSVGNLIRLLESLEAKMVQDHLPRPVYVKTRHAPNVVWPQGDDYRTDVDISRGKN
jgi:hypothetical protein